MALIRGDSPLLPFLVSSLVLLPWAAGKGGANDSGDGDLGRSGFPEGFLFGAASSSYQYEGGVAEDGRGPSIWDTFTHKHPDKIKDGSNGDIAIDAYHRYKDDLKLMKDMGMNAYRFSISWSRILPNGSLSGGVNQQGIDYYSNLVDYALSQGLQPFATLLHFDSPQTLEDAYGGFLSRNIVADFRNYSEVCFRALGGRVRHWITFNEPWTFCSLGYALGSAAPGRCSPSVSDTCAPGDSGREPYAACHNLLLAHAEAVKLYRDEYQAAHKGVIGITLPSSWFIPVSEAKSDKDAVNRALDFMYGWFMDPLTQGDYPFIMRAVVRERLPTFTRAQSEMIRGSFDFLGLNYYTSSYVSSLPFSSTLQADNASYLTDSGAITSGFRKGKPIGAKAASSWLFVYPPGIKELLLYVKNTYNNPVIYITENGVDELNNGTMSREEALKDDMRIEYHKQHLFYIQQAIRAGVDVRGYFAWSLLDNFEWFDGYTVRFGLHYVDFGDRELKRYPKSSARWFREFLSI